jgi:hypothetical protein
MHWIDAIKEGRRSFICLGDECPLCTIAGDQPRPRFVFNVLVVTDEEPNVQLLSATPTLFKILRSKNEDAKTGPLSKYYWAISRQGAGPQTAYTLDRVRSTDLAEEWELDAEKLDELAGSAQKYGPESVYITPRAELLTIARSLI